MKLSSSNKNKIKEFQRIIPELEIIQGPDLQEVDGTMDEVILYKAIDAGKDMIVEDTILKIDGKEVVDIKWNKEYKTNNLKVATWIVSVGYNDGSNIYVARGIVNGILVEPQGEGFGFDPYFIPDGADITLAQLEMEGIKDKYSARLRALLNLKNKRVEFIRKINEVSPWTGKYQNQ